MINEHNIHSNRIALKFMFQTTQFCVIKVHYRYTIQYTKPAEYRFRRLIAKKKKKKLK